MKVFTKKKKSEQPQTPNASYYTSIHKLPLERFVDVLVDKNLQALVINGNPTLSELQDAWDEILFQYEQAMGSQNLQHYLEAWTKVQACQLRYNRIDALVATLKQCYVKEFADRLCRLTHKSFQYDPGNLEAYKTFKAL